MQRLFDDNAILATTPSLSYIVSILRSWGQVLYTRIWENYQKPDKRAITFAKVLNKIIAHPMLKKISQFILEASSIATFKRGLKLEVEQSIYLDHGAMNDSG